MTGGTGGSIDNLDAMEVSVILSDTMVARGRKKQEEGRFSEPEQQLVLLLTA